MPIAINGSGTLTGLSVGGLEDGIITPAELSTGGPGWDAQSNLTNVASINAGPLAGMRNAIINGNFDIWQRGTSFTGSEYGADRWLNARSGTTHTVTRQPFTLGQTDVPGEPTYFCRTVVSSVAGAGNYAIAIQAIEGVRAFAGQQATISFWAKADASKNIAIDCQQNFGTGGSPSSAVNAIGTVKKALTASWQKITHTFTITSVAGKTLGTDGNDSLALFIWFDAGSTFNARTDSLGQQSGTFDIAQVQMEPGPVATLFERRPIGTELSLCQRYFCITRGSHRFYSTINTQTGENQVYWPVQMRAAPTTTISTSGQRQNVNIVSLNSQTQYGSRFVLTAISLTIDTFALNEIITASAEL
jgi:hypothetical protein